jgi:hypothetical protein
MVEQIEGSIKFDCSPHSLPEPVRPQFWHEQAIAAAKSSIAYYAKSNQEELERTKGRNDWVKALSASVPMPAN